MQPQAQLPASPILMGTWHQLAGTTLNDWQAQSTKRCLSNENGPASAVAAGRAFRPCPDGVHHILVPDTPVQEPGQSRQTLWCAWMDIISSMPASIYRTWRPSHPTRYAARNITHASNVDHTCVF